MQFRLFNILTMFLLCLMVTEILGELCKVLGVPAPLTDCKKECDVAFAMGTCPAGFTCCTF